MNEKVFYYAKFSLITLLLNIQHCFSNDCLNIGISLTQKIEHEGFHRELRWLIETAIPDEGKWLNSNCTMAFRQEISKGMFFNPDEIDEMKRIGKLNYYIDGEVDVEAAAHEANENVLYIFLNSSDIFRTSLNIPFHLRYQRAQIGGKYGKVPLNKPNIIIWCSESLNKICGKGLKVEAPCDETAREICVWKNLNYHALFDEVELFVPVGNLDDYPFVSITTLLLGCAGCIYILSLLATSPL